MSDANFRVRRAMPDDAAGLIAHVHTLCDEPGVCITMDRDEFALTVDDERKFVAETNAAPNSVFLIAESTVDGQIIGLLIAHGGKRRATRHEAVLAISVNAEWRRRGVGAALMAACVDWAKSTGIVKRIELRVFTRNVEAIRLYERFGFETEGVTRRSVFREGEYEDNRVMALLL